MAKFIDLTGKKFGRLTVLHRSDNTTHGYAHWVCKCDCGSTSSPSGMALRKGNTQSCGCLRSETAGKTRFIDLTGKKFGHLIVVSKHGHIGKDISWSCLCACGGLYIARGSTLRNRTCQSCRKCEYEGHVLPTNVIGSHHVLRQYQRAAEGRGIAWSLSDEEFYVLIQRNCNYCDKPPSNRGKGSKRDRQKFLYNGIDRRDNTVGYAADNCVPCCGICNRWKSNMSESEFYEHVNRIASLNKTMTIAGGR